MTEQERFDRCLAELLRLEGGYADDARDPGGPTRWGVTQAVLSQARGRPVSPEAVMALSAAEAGAIYRDRYWDPLRCGRMAAGLDLMVLDAAVNMGPGAAARLLQAALGLDADGAVGERTLAAAAQARTGPLIEAVARLRGERYRRLADFPVFGAGWLRRLETVRTLALAWAAADAGEAAA